MMIRTKNDDKDKNVASKKINNNTKILNIKNHVRKIMTQHKIVKSTLDAILKIPIVQCASFLSVTFAS